jgi:uncharacterized membrane protein
MFSKKFKRNKKFSTTGFRYRGIENSRIEQLTDAVFAFALTLLVIASEVPRTYVELQASMYNFFGFIACSLLLLGIWSNHSNFYLHYGMQDRKTRFLNFLFLFVLLYYIYPLKYLFSHLSNLIWVNFIGEAGLKNPAFKIAYDQAVEAQLDVSQWQDLMIRFGLGLLVIYLILTVMHINALLKKKALELNEQEEHETKQLIFNYIFLCLVCITSMTVVIITGGKGSGVSGAVYFLIPTVLPLLKGYQRKRLKKKFPDTSNQIEQVEEKWSEEKANEIIYEAMLEVESEKKKEASKTALPPDDLIA